MSPDAVVEGASNSSQDLARHFAQAFVFKVQSGMDPYDELALLRFTGGARGARMKLLNSIAGQCEQESALLISMSTLVTRSLDAIRSSGTTSRLLDELCEYEAILISDLDCDVAKPETWLQVQLLISALWRERVAIASAGTSSLATPWVNVPTGWFDVPLTP